MKGSRERLTRKEKEVRVYCVEYGFHMNMCVPASCPPMRSSHFDATRYGRTMIRRPTLRQKRLESQTSRPHSNTISSVAGHIQVTSDYTITWESPMESFPSPAT
jgi:hypothetical protein